MKTQGEALIREQLAQYVRLLKEEFSQGLILPTKNSSSNLSSAATSTKPTTIVSRTSINNSSSSSGKKTNGSDFETKELNVHDFFKCSRSDLFQVFTDLNMVRAFTQNSVTQYECQQAGSFSLFGDNITGQFLEITPYERIDMMWRFKSWPKEHLSHVTLTFEEEAEQTKLTIHQTGVPAQFYENTMVRSRSIRILFFSLKNFTEQIDENFFFDFSRFRTVGNDFTSRASNQHLVMAPVYSKNKTDSKKRKKQSFS